MLKFYILISNNVGSLLRHLSPYYSGLSSEDMEVVINSLDDTFIRDAIHFCKENGIRYHLTESNGTPAKGKNELLKIFEESDNDYMVQIDGDDYLTPYGVWLYKKVAAGKKVPDIICLKNQIAVVMEGKMFEESEKSLRKFFTIDYENMDYGTIFSSMSKRIPEERAHLYTEYHKTFYANSQKYCDDHESHCRVVFFSKKAAKHRFDENFVVGEDTLHYLTLKNEHFEGNINMVVNDEAPASYIYDQLQGYGTVWTTSKGFTNWDWMNKFNQEVEVYKEKGILHEKDLPLLKINYDSPDVPGDCDTAGPVRYTIDDRYLDLPANVSNKSLNELWKAHSRSIEK